MARTDRILLGVATLVLALGATAGGAGAQPSAPAAPGTAPVPVAAPVPLVAPEPTATAAYPTGGLVCYPRCTPCPRRLKFGVEIEGALVWQSRNDVAIPGDTGTEFALDDLTGAGPFVAGRVTAEWDPHPRHGVRLVLAPLGFTGTDRLERPVSFDGVTFPAGVPTEATYRFDTYRLTYRYRLVCRPRWNLRVGATVLLRDAEIGLDQGVRQATKTDLGVVPLLHLDAEVRLAPRWRLVFDADGLAAEQGRAFDVALKVHYDLTDRWNVGVGYRTIEGGADNDEVYTFAWIHQAVLSVGYRF